MGFFTSELEFTLFIIAAIANVSLAVIVWRFAEKNLSKYLFIIFVFAQLLWISINYYSFQVSWNNYLAWSRMILFTSPFHALAFYLFIKTFLTDQESISKKLLIPLIIIACLVAIYTLTPMVLSNIVINSDGTRSAIFAKTAGVYLSFIFIFIGGGFITLVKRFIRAKGERRTQWSFLLAGLALTFLLVIAFSLLNPLIFGNIGTVRFGHLFTLPFVIFTAYAMVRHHLLNLKTVVAELAVILLNLLLLMRFITSEDLSQYITNGFVLIGALIIGILLVKGVYREIHQREQLEILNKQLDSANEKLKELDQARAEFISIASHQLRTPPATIKWYLAAIQSGDFGNIPEDAKNALQKAEMTNNAQISLIDDLLNASRIERGKMEFFFEVGSVVQITQATYEQLIPQAKMKKLELVYNKPTEPIPDVVMDREKLRQVINNFIDNAIKYTRSGKIVATVSRDENNVKVQVSDSGKGILPEHINILFEKYTRGKDSVMHATGLGLGLYVAKVIIEKHNGKIWAESEGEGKGSKFIFTLPIHNTIEPHSMGTLDLAQSASEHK